VMSAMAAMMGSPASEPGRAYHFEPDGASPGQASQGNILSNFTRCVRPVPAAVRNDCGSMPGVTFGSIR
jgi:hypothetical protein